MDFYDPLNAPPPQAWLDLDAQQRIVLVEAYHATARIVLENEMRHAVIPIHLPA